jgi:Tol biopolymer transport system component
LMVVDVERGTERALTEGSAEEIRPVLSADGRLAAFASNRDGKWAIYVAPLDRAPVRDPILVGFVDENAITGRRGQRYDWWTSTGMLTIPLSHDGNNIYRLPVDPTTGRATGAPQRLTQDAPRNFGPAVSPDGSQIAYQYRNGSKAGIALMDAAGVSERPVIELQGNLPIHWRSADEILYYNFAAPSGERPAITTYNVKTGLKTPVARVEGLYWQYVPSRNAIVHSHPGGGGPRAGNRLKIWSIADGTDRDVASIDFLVPWWSVSPDGRRIAFSVARNADTSGVQCELALMSIDGVREKTLMGNDGRATQFGSDPSICGIPTSWSPDGRFLLVNTTTKGARVVNVETGEAWPLHSAIDTQNWDARSWSPDGKFIAMTFSSSRVERLAWEGVTYEAVTRLLTRSARR